MPTVPVSTTRELRWFSPGQRVLRTNEDVYRSVKKYVATMLGEDYDVRLVEEEGTFLRPSSIITPAAVASAVEGDGQFFVTMIQPFAIYVYPAVGDSATATRINSLKVEEILLQGFRFGVGEGRPMRLPLYAYDEVPVTEGSVQRGHADFARITDLSVGSLQDPNDRTLWSVTAEIRLSWRRTPQVSSAPGLVVESVTAQPEDPA